MKFFKYRDIEADISKEIYEELNMKEITPDLLTETIADGFFSDPLYREYSELYGEKNKLEKTCILWAHGTDNEKKWKYIDNNKILDVQKWINKNDGKYITLMLNCCNAFAHDIFSKKSLVFVPNQEISIVRRECGLVQIELYIPKKGYLSNYEIEDELEKIKGER
jgi:hypothetical protein